MIPLEKSHFVQLFESGEFVLRQITKHFELEGYFTSE
jgi:hypothetical protein